jgi:hypothetical protein
MTPRTKRLAAFVLGVLSTGLLSLYLLALDAGKYP